MSDSVAYGNTNLGNAPTRLPLLIRHRLWTRTQLITVCLGLALGSSALFLTFREWDRTYWERSAAQASFISGTMVDFCDIVPEQCPAATRHGPAFYHAISDKEHRALAQDLRPFVLVVSALVFPGLIGYLVFTWSGSQAAMGASRSSSSDSTSGFRAFANKGRGIAHWLVAGVIGVEVVSLFLPPLLSGTEYGGAIVATRATSLAVGYFFGLRVAERRARARGITFSYGMAAMRIFAVAVVPAFIFGSTAREYSPSTSSTQLIWGAAIHAMVVLLLWRFVRRTREPRLDPGPLVAPLEA